MLLSMSLAEVILVSLPVQLHIQLVIVLMY